MPERPKTQDELWALYFASRDDSLVPLIAEHWIPLVEKIAGIVVSKIPESANIAVEDLMAPGILGVMECIRKFDPSRSKFETFSWHRIRGKMIDEIRSFDEFSRTDRRRIKDLERAKRDFYKTHGRMPVIDELDAIHAAARIPDVISLHSEIEHSGEKAVNRFGYIGDARQKDPSDRLERFDTLRKLTRGLNKAERILVIMYYYEGRTMKQIANVLGLSESRVSQMHDGILERIREKYRLEEVT